MRRAYAFSNANTPVKYINRANLSHAHRANLSHVHRANLSHVHRANQSYIHNANLSHAHKTNLSHVHRHIFHRANIYIYKHTKWQLQYYCIPYTEVLGNMCTSIFLLKVSQYSPAAAMCSLVLIGWNPTNGICIDSRVPTI